MKNIFIRILILLSIPQSAFRQDSNDWPSSSFEHSYENANEKAGLEHYKSGHLQARGPITKSGSRDVVKVSENRKQVKETVYDRSGTWTVYYDSAVSIVRSTGKYTEGRKNGLWKLFSKNGNLRSEYTFVKDFVKTRVDIDNSGNRNVVVNRSDGTVFVQNNETLLFCFGLIPVVVMRWFGNLVIWNKIYRTNYIPGFAKFKKGEIDANVYCSIIFWWLKKEDDTDEIRTFKNIGNWISVLSLVALGTFATLLSMFGE